VQERRSVYFGVLVSAPLSGIYVGTDCTRLESPYRYQTV